MPSLSFSLCTDNNYAIPAMVCITSIFENHRGIDCKVYVLTAELSKESIDKFNNLAKVYNQQIVIHQIENNAFYELKTIHRYGTSMYYRFLLPEIINESRVLYLDCDIIVRKNLSDLFNTNLDNLACGVIEDQRGDEIELHNRILVDSPYFNSGVLLMNLDYWRENNIKDKLVTYILKYPERCKFPDQDALNAILANKVKFLPYTYNFQEQWYWEDDNKAISFKKWPEINKYKDDPAIVHYTWNLKPWMEQCWHIHKDWFLEYAKMYEWIGFKIRKKYKPTFISRCFAFLLRFALNGIRKSDIIIAKKDANDILSFYNIK